MRTKKITYDEKSGEVIKQLDYREKKYQPSDGVIYKPIRKRATISTAELEEVVTICTDLDKIIKLCKYSSLTDNELRVVFESGYTRSMTKNDMEVILCATPRSVNDFLRRMNKAGVIRAINGINAEKKRKKMYYFNPYFVSLTNKITPELFYLFNDFLEDDLPEQDKVILKKIGK